MLRPSAAAAAAAGGRSAVRTVVVRISRKLKAVYRLHPGRRFSDLLLALVAAVAPPAALALPQGERLVAGESVIERPSASTMVIQQGTNKSILEWGSYNIGAGESVRYVQPGASSVSLNRIGGASASQILGSLTANGQVFLVNPAGVLFGPGASVNVGGLVASSLALNNDDFLAGRYHFGGGGNGSVRNQGSITGGYVALAGPEVSNAGTINAPGGAVGLLAGARVSVDPAGAGLVRFSVDAGAVRAAVANSGTIQADGGSVLLAAQALSDALPTVINQAGVIRANSIAERNGTIILSGGPLGVVSNSGTLEARGANAGESGGTVKVLGERVGLFAGTRVDASGEAGGGTVLVGGNFQGLGPEPNAVVTHVDADARIRADAGTRGDGGKVILWSDHTTRFLGEISARGGAQGGDGGFVETSGKEHLDYRGRVDTRAPRGRSGTLLLDPAVINIQDGVGDSGDGSSSSFGGVPSGTPGTVLATDTGPSTLYESELEGMAATTNIVVAASVAINVADLADNELSLAQTAGHSVTFTAPNFTMADLGDRIATAGGDLTIQAEVAIIGGLNANGGLVTLDIGLYGDVFGAIAGTGTALTKAGSGTLQLRGANTYTGATAIDHGVLSVQNGAAIPDGGAVRVELGATLDLVSSERIGSLSGLGTVNLYDQTLRTGGNNADVQFSGTLMGGAASALIKEGTGAFALGGASPAFDGAIQVAGGTLLARNANALGSSAGATSVASGAELDIDNVAIALEPLNLGGILRGTRSASLGGPITLTSADAAFLVNTDDRLRLSGAIDDGASNFGFVKLGSGTLTLAGANSHGGTVTVATGTVVASHATALGGTGAGTVVLSGATLQLADGVTVAEPITVSGTGVDGAGALTASGNAAATGAILLGNNATVGATAGSVLSLSGVIANGSSGNLAKLGPGTVSLAGANTYTGATTVTQGTLALGASNALPDTTTLTVNGATAALDLGAFSDTVAGVSLQGGGAITGSGMLTSTSDFDLRSGTVQARLGGAVGLDKTGAGTVTLSGANTYTGVTTLAGGVLSISADANLGAEPGAETPGHLVFDGGTLQATNGFVLSANRGISFGAAGGTIDVAGDLNMVLDYAGQAAGPGGFTKTGDGDLWLRGANSYAGTTVIDAGTLSMSSSSALGASDAGTTVASGATLALFGSITMAEPLTLNGSGMAGRGALRHHIGNANLSGAITLGSDGPVIAVDPGDTLSLSGQLSGSSLTKRGPGILRLLGNSLNDYTGATRIEEGGLRVLSGSAIPDASPVTIDAGASLSVEAGESIGSLAGGGRVQLGATLRTGGDGSDTSFSGAILGGVDGALVKEGGGVFTLSGASSYAGATRVEAGTLVAQHAAALGAPGGGGDTQVAAGATLAIGAGIDLPEAIVLQDGATLRGLGNAQASGVVAIATGAAAFLAAGTADTFTLSAPIVNGAVSGGGSLRKIDGGTVILSGANTYQGAAFVDAGTLVLAGGSALADGNPVTVAGGATLALQASETIGSLAGVAGGSVELNAHTLTTGGNDSSTSFAGQISGTGGLVKTGSGVFTLAGANTYSGATDVDAGALRATASGALGSSAGGTTVADGAVLELEGGITLADTLTVSGNGLGSGAIRNVDGDNTLSGALVLAGATTIQSDSRTLELAGAITGAGSKLTLRGAGDGRIAGAIATGSGAVQMDGPGTWRLQNANSYTGGTTLTAGTLRAEGVATALGTGVLTLNGGVLQLAGDSGIVFGNDTVVAGDATIQSMRQSPGAGVTHTLGSLAIGAHTLAIEAGPDVSSGTAGVAFGATTLSGGATFAPGANAALALGAVDGAGQALAVNGDGLIAFEGAVGAGGALASVAVTAGGITLRDVATSGKQTYAGPVTLGADGVLAAGGDVSFAGSVDGGFALAVDAAGATTFGGAVGGTTALASLTTDAPGAVTIAGGGVRTTGAQTYNDALTLGADTVLDAGASTIRLQSVTGAGHDLDLAATGGVTATTIGGVDALQTGAGTHLSASAVTAAAARLGGDVSTTGAQTYGATTLTDDVALSGSTLALGEVAGNGNDLALTGDTTAGTVAGIGTLTTTSGTDLSAASVQAAAARLGGDVSTTGAQTYGATTLTDHVALSGSALALGAVTGNGNDLSLTGDTTAGTVAGVGTLTTAVGTGVSAASVQAVAASLGGDVTTTGAQTYGGTTLTGDAALSGSALTLGAVTGNGNDLALTGDTSAGTVAGIGTLTTASGTAISASGVQAAAASLGGNVTTSGAQTYGATMLTDDIALRGSALSLGDVTGNGNDLSLTGDTTAGTVAGIGTLTTASGTAISASGVQAAAASLGGNVTTTGAQTYGATMLTDDVALSGSALTLGAVTGNGNDLSLTGDTTAGAVAGVGTLTTAVGTGIGAASVQASAASLGGNVATSGAQTYGATTLTHDVALSGTTLSLGDVTGNGRDLTLTGATSAGVIAGIRTLRTLGGTAIDAASLVADSASLDGDVTTTGAQAYEGAVTLTDSATLSGSGVSFGGDVTGAHDLSVNSAGTTSFGGAVTVASLTTDAGGTTAIDGGAITTTGDQTYNDAVTLGADTTLTGTGGGAITLIGRVDGARNLTITTSGLTTLLGTAGGTTRLASLTTNGGGTTDINADVFTTGAQTYSDAVVLSTDVALDASAGNITFGAAVDGAGFDLAIRTPATARFTTASGIGTLDFGGGTLASSGTVTAGNYTLRGGTVDAALGTGTLDILGETTLNGTSAASTLRIEAGTLTLGPADDRLRAPANVSVAAGATLDTGSGSQQLGPALTNEGTLVVPGKVVLGTLASPGVLQTGTGSHVEASGAIAAANEANTIGDGTRFTSPGDIDLRGDFAGAVQVDGGSHAVNLDDTSASPLAVDRMQVAGDATVTIASVGNVGIETPAFGPMRDLTITAPRIHFAHSQQAHPGNGSQGLLVSQEATLNIAADGVLNAADDPLFIHADTPLVRIPNGTLNPLNFHIAGNVEAVPQQRVVNQQLRGASAAIHAEVARELLRLLRADTGLLNVEMLVLLGNLGLGAVIAPLSFTHLEIREPRCAAAQRRGEAGCR